MNCLYSAPFKSLLLQLLPNRCLLCKQMSKTQLCLYCRSDLSFFDYHRFDNLLLRPDIKDGLKHPKFDRLISLAPYQWPFNQWLVELKFSKQFNLGSFVGEQLANLVKYLAQNNPKLLPEKVIPMPIHRSRLFTRGYNQSHLLSQSICQVLNLPLDARSLTRVKATLPQTSLGQRARQNNVKNAFKYEGPPSEHIALVDDVITTGSTVNEVCNVLKLNKVKTVSIWTVCATPLHKKRTKSCEK